MAILTYQHQWGRQILKGLGCILGHFSLDGDQHSFRGIWHLCGIQPTMINSRTEMLRPGECRTRSSPKKSQVPRVCAPDPKELHFLQKLQREQGSKGTGSVQLDPRGTEKVTWNSLTSIFFPEIQPSAVCWAQEYSAWIPFFIQPSLNNLVGEVLLSSSSRWENWPDFK